MNEPIILAQGAKLYAHPARSYKSKRYQDAYCCTHCRETLSGRPIAYSLWLPRKVPIPARDANQIFLDFCSEEHARFWLDNQLAQERAKNQARSLAFRASLSVTKVCINCKREFPVNGRGDLVVPYFDIHSSICERCGVPLAVTYEEEGRLSFICPQHHLAGSGPQYYGHSSMRCPQCEEERRKKNRQAYPLCPMCSTPTHVGNFLREYRGFTLDIIKVCCQNCIPQFETMAESEQMNLLHLAIVKTYGDTAVIYALQYDDAFFCQHIGRTKHLKRRMAEYRRGWYCEIKAYRVLEELSFGGLSMERESRWMLHALKHNWPIDNFDMYAPDKHTERSEPAAEADGVVLHTSENIHEKEQRKKELLTVVVTDIEPLTAPFEVIEPLLRKFMNTSDTRIVHWFGEQTGIVPSLFAVPTLNL